MLLMPFDNQRQQHDVDRESDVAIHDRDSDKNHDLQYTYVLRLNAREGLEDKSAHTRHVSMNIGLQRQRENMQPRRHRWVS